MNHLLKTMQQSNVAIILLLTLTTVLGMSQLVAQDDSDKTKVQPSRERFIPVDQLDAILKQTPSGILLPKSDFQALLSKARQAAQTSSPGDAVIASARYNLSAEQHRALIELTIQFRQFKKGWTTQSIPIGNLQLESAELNEATATVGTSDKQPGRLLILNDTVGTFELKLTLSTPLLKSGTDRSVVFKSLDNAPATLDVSCPAGEHVILNARKLERLNDLTEPTTYVAAIGNTSQKPGDVRVTWTTRQQQEISDNLVFATSTIQASLSDAGLKWQCESRLSVFGEKFDRLSASIPATLEITNVESAGLEQWTLEDDPETPDRIRLQLKYRQPFSQDRLIRIDAVSTVTLQNSRQHPNASSQIPTLHWNQLTAHTGQIAIQTESTQRLLTEPVSGLDRIASQQRTNRQFDQQADVFSFWKQNFDLQVSIRSKDRELFSKIDSILHTVDTTMTFQSTLTVETLNEPLFDVTVEVPEDWQIQSLTNSSSANLPWTHAADGKSILIELPKPVEAGQLLTMCLNATRTINDPTDSQAVPLPIVKVTGAIQAEVTYSLSCASDLKLSFPQLIGLVPIADSNRRLVFEAQTSAYGGTVQVDRQVTRLATRSELRTWMEPDTVATEIDLTVDVVNGSIRILTVNLPESLTAAVRFQLRAIGQVPGQSQPNVPNRINIIEQTALPVQNGVRPFRLTFDKRFVGSINLFAMVENDRDDNFEWLAPFVRINEAARQQGLIVYEARPEQQLHVIDPDAIKELTIADASMVPVCDRNSNRRVAMVFRYVTPDYSLTVGETTFETQTVPSAVCQNIQNVVVYDVQQSIQRSARIDFQTSGVQTLRFRLPANSYLWSTVLDGKAVQVRRDATDYLVALPISTLGSSDQSHKLELLFQSAANKDQQQTTVQDSVALLIDTNDGSSTSVEILQQSWKLSYPSTMALTEVPSGFQLQNGKPGRGWIQSMIEHLQAYQRPSNQVLTARTVPVVVALLALFVFTTLISRKHWKTLLGLGIASVIVILAPLALNTSMTSLMPTSETASMRADATPGFWGGAEDGKQGLSEQADASINMSSNNAMEGGFGGGQGGGLGGGGFGGGTGSGFAGGSGSGSGGDGGFSIAGQAAQNDPFADDIQFDGTINGRILNEQAGDDPSQQSPFDSVQQAKERGTDLMVLGRNAALLSVKANVANPDHFLSTEFRSINSGSANQSFPVQLQSAQVKQAFMIVAAAVAILICLYFSKATIVVQITLICFLTFTIAALVPLLSVRWQPIADGLFIGSCAGIALWICLSLARLCATCCKPKTVVQLQGISNKAAQSAGTTATVLLMICAASQSTWAQQSNRPPVTTANQAVINQAAAATQRAADVSTEAESAASKSAIQPDIVLPYQPGQPELLADKVFLPKEQFLQLYRLANPDQLQEGNADKAARLIAAYYTSGQIKPTSGTQSTDPQQWVQKFEARYVIKTFDGQPAMVTLPIKNTSMILATIQSQFDDSESEKSQPQNGDQPALIAPTADGGFQVKVQGAGLHVVDVAFRVALEKQETTGQVELTLLPVATGTIAYELPADNLKVTVNDQLNGLRRTDRKVVVPIAAGGPFLIRWSPEGTQEARNTFFHVNSRSAVSIGNQGLSTVSTLNVTVRQGAINRITVNLPAADSILAVQGANISGWQTVSQAEQNELTIDFLEPVDGQAVVTVNRFRKATIDSTAVDFQVPIPSVVGATRDSGTVAVQVENGFDIRVSSLSSVSQIDSNTVQLPDLMQSGSKRTAAAFRYTRQPAVVKLKIQRDPVRQTVDIVNAVQVDLQRQRWTTLVRTQTNGTAVRQLRIALPKNFLVLDVQANGMQDWYIADPEEMAGNENANSDTVSERLLTILLSEARMGTVNAVIQGQTGRSGNGRLETLNGPSLPVTAISAENRFRGQLHVWLDDTSEISSIQADEWKRVPAGTSAPVEVRNLNPAAPAVSFTSTSSSASTVQLNLRKSAPSFLAESVLVTNVTDTSLELSLALNWQISRAAGADFSFSIPSDFADAFDFRIPGLRQLDQQQDGDRTKFIVRLQQPVTDQFFVMGTATLPLPSENRIQPFDTRFAVSDSSEAIISGQTHYWVLVNQSAGLLQLADINSQPSEVESSELKTNIPKGFLQQSVSIQRCKANGQTLPWKLSFPESEQVTPAVISLAAHRLIIAEDGSWKSHHRLQVRNEGRQFLPILLPEESRFLSCLVKGRPSRIVLQETAGQARSLIPIPQSGRLATVFEVEFLLAGQLDIRPTNLAGQPIDLPLPAFPEFRDDPDYGISIARNTLKVFTPKAWHASAVDDPQVTNVVAAQQEQLEDAQLLSAVDNLRNLIDSAKSSNNDVADVRLQAQFFDQKQVLDSLGGNSKDAATERNRLLREFDDFSASNSLKNWNAPTNSSDIQQLDSIKLELGNTVLQEIDLNQNRFIIDNNDEFISGNGGYGIPQNSNSSDSRFNFVLPEAATDKASKAKEQSLPQSFKGKKSKSDGKPSGGKAGQNRSQLMQRSQSSKGGRSMGRMESGGSMNRPFNRVENEMLQNSQNAVPGATRGLDVVAPDAFFMPNADFDIPAIQSLNSSITPNQSPNFQIIEPQIAESDFQIQIESQGQSPQNSPQVGLLSLDFELPESGNEADFIRTGGNPRLTLKVRDTKQVKTSYGWLWAAVCVGLFFAIRGTLVKSPERLAIRLLWLGLIMALAGWIFLPETASIACLITTVLLALILSVMTIYRSFMHTQPA